MNYIACLLAALLFSTPVHATTPADAGVDSPISSAAVVPPPIKLIDQHQHGGVQMAPNVATFVVWNTMTRTTLAGFNWFLREAHRRDAELQIYISSPGGDAEVGLAMYEALETYPHKVTCTVGPLAASAAFLILQACDRRIADPRSILLTHRVSVSLGDGPPADARLTPEELLELVTQLTQTDGRDHCEAPAHDFARVPEEGGRRQGLEDDRG
jgi:membrane-bound ClpP family serine protease